MQGWGHPQVTVGSIGPQCAVIRDQDESLTLSYRFRYSCSLGLLHLGRGCRLLNLTSACNKDQPRRLELLPKWPHGYLGLYSLRDLGGKDHRARVGCENKFPKKTCLEVRSRCWPILLYTQRIKTAKLDEYLLIDVNLNIPKTATTWVNKKNLGSGLLYLFCTDGSTVHAILAPF